MTSKKFSELGLRPELQETLKKIGYDTPTPIQERTIPLVLDGNDVLGIAQTGTGKTAAFCLPILDLLLTRDVPLKPKQPRALILTPTRELAIQIHENLKSYGQNTKQKFAVIFGGVSQGKQVNSLKNGTDVLVATPGRLLDLINQRFIDLGHVEKFVLDEADRMLDMGFLKDITKVINMLPKSRQNLFFSATMPAEIQKLSGKILRNPKKVEVTPPSTTVEKITQSVMYVEKSDKIALLTELLKNKEGQKTLVFVEMKHVANKIAKKLETKGIPAAVIHGNKSQTARQNAISDFTKNKVSVMIATDIASRGVDIDGITHVINYQLSNIAENYVHRIGRTARAGASGTAISLVTADEKSFLYNIEKVTRTQIAVDKEHLFHSEEAFNAPVVKVGRAKAKIEKDRKKELNEFYRNKPSKKSSKKSRSRHRNGGGKPGAASKKSRGSSSTANKSRSR